MVGEGSSYPELINRNVVVFQYDYVRPVASFMVRQKMTEFGWKILIHQP